MLLREITSIESNWSDKTHPSARPYIHADDYNTYMYMYVAVEGLAARLCNKAVIFSSTRCTGSRFPHCPENLFALKVRTNCLNLLPTHVPHIQN